MTSENFLLNLMRVAHQVTRAERAFAVDNQLNILGSIKIEPEKIEAPYLKSMKKAMEDSKAIITDNYTMTIEPSKAPITNQSFPQLRAVVVIPVSGHGAICVDQRLRGGIVAKEKVDKLSRLTEQVLASNRLDISEDDLLKMYNSLN